MKKGLLAVVLFLALFLVVPPGSTASTFNNLVVFGDSLSDTGNVARFTDAGANIWVETLANSLGANLYDFAYGGATTGYDNPAIYSPYTGLQWQIESYMPSLTSISMDENLSSVWAGANDFLQGRDYFSAAFNIGTALDKLYDAGANDILVGNLPDIGLTPLMYNTPTQGLASAWTLGFNTALETVLSGFRTAHTDVNIYTLDAYGIFSSYLPMTQAWSELFWVDGFHPSASGHQLIFEAAAAAIPEPTTIALLGFGLLGIAGVSRKKSYS